MNKMICRLLTCTLALVVVVVGAGCSKFDNEYGKALGSTPAPDTIEGPWVGRWESQGGHGGGDLRAMVTQTGPDVYLATFRATYWGIFQTEHETLLRAHATTPAHAS